MLSHEDNEILTRVGRGTPGGELLRRYWHPVAAAAELTDEKPIKAIKILGESLVLFRDKSGNYGMVAEQCPHRFASLAYGSVDQEGIRCPYHGWKFDGAGKCLEAPAERKDSHFHESVRTEAYPVRRLGGMLFSYMGPLPVPALPHWDVLTWAKGVRRVERHSVLRCNWVQAMENSVDPSHLYWLHGRTAHLAATLDHYEEEHDFTVFDYGIMKRRTSAGKVGARVDQHPLLFPNILRHVFNTEKSGKLFHNLQYRVPIDDVTTQVFMVLFTPDENVLSPPTADTPFEYVSMTDQNGAYRMDMVLAQDVMAWETQGPIFDRSRERLGSADKGVIILRRLLREQMDSVKNGRVPLGVKPAQDEARLIELEVINERIGLNRPQTEVAA